MPEHPLARKLCNEDWNIFATLTFDNASVKWSPDRKWKAVVTHLRQAAKALPVTGQSGSVKPIGRRFENMPWLVRSELGEKTGRHHYHYLLTGLSNSDLVVSHNFIVMDLWKKLTNSNARVWKYDHSLPGVQYVLKGCQEYFQLSGAMAYELGKFSAIEDELGLTFGHALQRKWGKAMPDKKGRQAILTSSRGGRGRTRRLHTTQGTGLGSAHSQRVAGDRPAKVKTSKRLPSFWDADNARKA